MNLAVGWLAAAAALATPAAAAPALLTGPDLGPDAPLAGRSLLDEIFPAGLPTPFEAVLNRLRTLAGPENVATALIPLGRSLQRYGADPDYFASPRLVVAVTGDLAAGPDGLRLGDRLFFGYQPAADVIEAISYNPAAGRFEFQEIVRYAADTPAAAEPAERRVCLACHQGQGPIFPRPLWSETNATPAIAARLVALGPTLPRRAGAPDRRRARALRRRHRPRRPSPARKPPLDGRLSRRPLPRRAPRRRAALRPHRRAADRHPRLLRRRARSGPTASPPISPDLPNRDPLRTRPKPWRPPAASTPRPRAPPSPLWQPDASAFAAAAREIAAEFSPGDLAWIDARLRRGPGRTETITLPCTTTAAALPGGASEARFTCAAVGARLDGFRAPGRPGRIALLSLPGAAADPRHRPAARRRPAARPASPTAAASSGSHSPPPPSSSRLADDLARLDAGLAAHPGAAALAAGPFPRSAALALIGSILGGTDG